MSWNENNGADSRSLERIADALDPPKQNEAERIRFEQDRALENVVPQLRHRAACSMFLEFTIRDGRTVSNPDYSPTPTMKERAERLESERLAHQRALELARASATVINIHNELPRRGWFR